MNDIQRMLHRKFVSGTLVFLWNTYTQSLPELNEKTLCNKGFTILLSTSLLNAAFTYSLRKLMTDVNLFKYWYGWMHVHGITVFLIICGRTVRVLQKMHE